MMARQVQTVAGETLKRTAHFECAMLIEDPASGFHQGPRHLPTKSGCMAAIFTF